MQNYLNKGSLEAGKKSITPFDVPIQKRAEKSNAPGNDYDPLTNITCKIGDKACSAKHNSVIQRSGLFHPINKNGKAQSLLRLQRHYGNRFVQKVITPHNLQAKPKIGYQGDVYEKEADRVSDAVMHMPQPVEQLKPERGDKITPLVQRQVEDEEEEKPLRPKKYSTLNSKVTPDIESHLHTLGKGKKGTVLFFKPQKGQKGDGS